MFFCIIKIWTNALILIIYCNILGRRVARAIARPRGNLGDRPSHVWEGAIYPTSI